MTLPQYVPIMPGESMASYVYRLCKANGMPLDIFTDIYMGEKHTWGQLDSGLFDAEKFCSFLPSKAEINPRKLLQEHTYHEIISNFVEFENYRSVYYYKDYSDKHANVGINAIKCQRCMEMDRKAGRPGYVHIEHCIPGVNRCYKHNLPLYVYESSYSTQIRKTLLSYTRNNQEYGRECSWIQRHGMFADRNRMVEGLDAAVRMLEMDGDYLYGALLMKGLTDKEIWETRAEYRGCSQSLVPAFNYKTNIPELMSILLLFFSTAKNIVRYYKSPRFETPENKAQLWMNLLTGNEYILEKAEYTDQEDVYFTALHTRCGKSCGFLLSEFGRGKRCDCVKHTEEEIIEMFNSTEIGRYYSIELDEAGIFHSKLSNGFRHPFNYNTRDIPRDAILDLTPEYVLQEITRPTYSPTFPLMMDTVLHNHTFAYIREHEGAVYDHIRRLFPGEIFRTADVMKWADMKHNYEIYVLNNYNPVIKGLLERAYYNDLYEKTENVGVYVRRKEAAV